MAVIADSARDALARPSHFPTLRSHEGRTEAWKAGKVIR
jgi:hypothetical protein